MKTAKFVRQIEGWQGDARLYRLSDPMAWEKWTSDDGVSKNEANHVIVSAVVALYSGPETYIFPADSDGNCLDFGELTGSFRGSLDHAAALEDAGYEVAT